jgi:hypothetical protein
MEKITAAYEHDPQDLTQIWMAASVSTPTDADWVPAFRDTVDGQRVIWIKSDVALRGNLWVRDAAGVRRASRLS